METSGSSESLPLPQSGSKKCYPSTCESGGFCTHLPNSPLPDHPAQSGEPAPPHATLSVAGFFLQLLSPPRPFQSFSLTLKSHHLFSTLPLSQPRLLRSTNSCFLPKLNPEDPALGVREGTGGSVEGGGRNGSSARGGTERKTENEILTP